VSPRLRVYTALRPSTIRGELQSASCCRSRTSATRSSGGEGLRGHRPAPQLYQFGTHDYGTAGKIWNGPHLEDGKECTFEHLPPDYGASVADLEPEPLLNSPLDPAMIADIMKKMK
jgi:hypothetical protein